MTCCVSMSTWGGESLNLGPTFFIDKLWFRWCCEEMRLFSFCCFCLSVSAFPYFLLMITFEIYKIWTISRNGKDFKDITILQVLNMGRWLRLCSRKSTSVWGSRESVGAGGLMKGSILLLFEQVEKLQLKLSSSWVLQNAVLKRSCRKPSLVISVLVKLCVLYSVLCCQMLPVKIKKGNNNMVGTVIWSSRCH